MTTKRAIPILAIALLGAAGCGSQDAPMTSAEKAQFMGGGPGKARSPEQQKAMSDFIAEFKKKHPGPGGPPQAGPKGPPAGQ